MIQDEAVALNKVCPPGDCLRATELASEIGYQGLIQWLSAGGTLDQAERIHGAGIPLHPSVVRLLSPIKPGPAIFLKLSRLLSLEDYAYGTVDGRLEKINVHAKANTFEIYPSVGPKSVRCRFPIHLEHIAITSIKRWVTVTGKLTYKEQDKFPSRMEVSGIDVHAATEDLPTLSDLKGVAPRATGRLKSENFTRRQRNEWPPSEPEPEPDHPSGHQGPIPTPTPGRSASPDPA